MKYGEYFKAQRELAGLSQSELSKRTGLSQQMISHWENNKGEPGIEKLVVLADFYGISLDELIGRTVKIN